MDYFDRVGRKRQARRENGDRGTDHGHGSVYWAMSGSINGGRILGEQGDGATIQRIFTGVHPTELGFV